MSFFTQKVETPATSKDDTSVHPPIWSNLVNYLTMRTDPQFWDSFLMHSRKSNSNHPFSYRPLKTLLIQFGLTFLSQKLPSGTAMVGIAKSTKGCDNSKKGCQSCAKSHGSQLEQTDNEALGNVFRKCIGAEIKNYTAVKQSEKKVTSRFLSSIILCQRLLKFRKSWIFHRTSTFHSAPRK